MELGAPIGNVTIPVAEALAREQSYGEALVRLHGSLYVRTASGCFASPVGERARLERDLRRRGLVLSSEAQLQPV